MRRVLALTALAAGTLFPAAGGSAQDPGGVGIRLLEAPTSREDDPRARRSIVDHVRPGTTFSRRFEVSNTTSGQRLIAIYAAGADIIGGAFVPADGRQQNELSRWITVDTMNADLAPGRTVQPRLTIAVPPTASEGERYAVVWAELPPSQPPPGSGPAVVNRVGLRVYLSVGASAEPRTDFVIESITAERDAQRRPVVKATVRNTGGRALDLDGNLRLSEGPNGLSGGPFPARLGTTLAIGATAPVAIPLDPAIADGPWRARIELRSGTTTRAAEATITFPSGPGAVGAPVSAQPVPVDDDSSSAFPDALLILAALGLIALLVLALVLLRRRVPSVPRPASGPVALLPLDDVLAELRTAEGPRRDELMGMAAAYGKDAILASPGLRALPVDTARALGEHVARTGR